MSTDHVDALVIFGATGDLAKLETFPALVGLVERGVLNVPVVGVAKSGWGLDQFRNYAIASLQLNKIDPASPAAATMLGLLRYVDGDLDDPATYEAMSNEMGQAQQALFYLEVPPPLFGRIAEGISKAGRATGSRVMVEKPFGTDLASAQQLNATMQAYFPEDAIYRVDHWLGLDPVDSLMFVRFANSVIEPLLNRNYVQSIQITMAEAFDVADRGSFYDKTGAIRDVVQNHLLQVLATVLAEPPDGTGLDSWREAKSQLIGALRPLTPEFTVKGQYDGYLQVAGVDPKSVTETYAAIRLAADSWRWADVPILIRAGKCLPVTATGGPPTACASGSTPRTGSACGWPARNRARAGSRSRRTCASPSTPVWTCAPTTASSAPPWSANAGCSPRRKPSRPPGASSTPCSATSCLSIPTRAAAGAPTRPPPCSPAASPGTTRPA